MRALDADGNGEISAKEIENAVAALKSLDKNKDGKLTRDEIRPEGGGGRPGFNRPGGEGRPGAQGRPGGNRRRGAEGRPGGNRRPGAEGRPDGARRPGEQGRRGSGGGDFIKRILENDKNKDGKITKDELPERMQRIFNFADANNDGVLDKAELQKMAERFRNRGDRSRGDRSRGSRPDGKKRGDGQRPKRSDKK
jgi:hypothetical protein